MSEPIRVLMAASGSGGHLFPAIFVAQALKNAASPADVEVRFVGSGRPLEAQLIDARGYKRYEIKIAGITGRGIKGVAQFGLAAPRAIRDVWRIFSEFKPDLIIGVGGYVSFLPVTLGFLRGIPTIIHEAELSPGLANRALSIFATKITCAFSELNLNKRKQVYTGHPLRPELSDVPPRDNSLGPPRRLLVLGGSQGAKALDQAMAGSVELLKRLGVEIHHQSRSENVELLSNAYKAGGISARVSSFFDDMVGEYSWSDVIVSRSGAAAVNEIDYVRRPSILVPLPTSQGGHQLVNAKTLGMKGRAIIVEEGEGFLRGFQEALEQSFSEQGYLDLLRGDSTEPEKGGSEAIARLGLSLLKHR